MKGLVINQIRLVGDKKVVTVPKKRADYKPGDYVKLVKIEEEESE